MNVVLDIIALTPEQLAEEQFFQKLPVIAALAAAAAAVHHRKK